MDDRALTIWVCEQLAEIGDDWVWSETGPYTGDVIGLFYGRIADQPDRGVGVRVYGGRDDPETGSKIRRVQLRFRGAPGSPDDVEVLADAAFDHLRVLMREGVISEVDRQSFSPAGSDKNQREERTDNYLFIFDNEEAPS